MYDLYPCRTLREYAAHMKHTKTRMEHAMWRIDYVLILILFFYGGKCQGHMWTRRVIFISFKSFFFFIWHVGLGLVLEELVMSWD